MYEYTTICQQVEKYGFLPWSANTDYPAQGCALGSDGKIYQAKQATGPSSTSIDPTTDTNHTYWELFYYADVTADRALVSNASGKMAASAVTATELGYLSGVTSPIQTQLNNKANNNEVVHLTGDETITGNKIFKGLLQKELTTANDWQEVLGIYDNSHTERGFISYIGNDQDGKQVVLISSMKDFNGTPKYATLYMIVDANGNTYVEAPASDINKSIVTTVNKNKAQNGYFKLGNGLIIQWGTVTAKNQVLTITLPTAFSNTNYIVSGSTMDFGKALFLRGKTTTTFRLDLDGGIGTATISWMAIGY
jgi:hypothetical protein